MSASNSFSQKVDIFFDEVLSGFEATNTTAKNVSNYKPNAGKLAEGGQTFYRPMPFLTEVVDGRDVSSAYKDLTELTVPSTLTDSHIRNVPISFTGKDINNPHIMQQAVTGATVMLNNKVDTVVANAIADNGTLVHTSSGDISTYDELSIPDTIMLEQQASKGQRCMLLNPRMAAKISGNLAGRDAMLAGTGLDAYRNASLQNIAGFDTYRVDYGKTITGSTGSGYLVNGADQDYTPVSKDGNNLPVDNRTQTLAVDTGSNAAVGDSFTIAGVYAVGHINKQSTGQLKTFRIKAINGSNWTISPAIVPADGTDQAQRDYANVNTTPADDAAISILNTTTKPCSVFYEKDCVEIIHADYNLDPFRETGKQVRVKTTDSGITIAMLSDSNVDTLVAKYRMFIWMNVEVLQPEAAGIILPNQV